MDAARRIALALRVGFSQGVEDVGHGGSGPRDRCAAAATGVPSYALLTALGRDSATLRAAGTEQTVTLAALAARWQGDFSTLWRTPPGYPGRTTGNPGGETLEWISASIGDRNGAAPPPARREFDAQLRTRLRAFQLAHGLAADGQPGPMTFMQLNRAAGVEEPRLRTDL